VTVNVKGYVAYGANCGDHVLGSEIKDAGATVAAGVVRLARNQSHRWAPRGPNGSDSLNLPAGYTKPAGVVMFRMKRESVAPAATVNKVRSYRSQTVNPGVTSGYAVVETTARKWRFTVAGTAIPGEYDPGDDNLHHVMIWVTMVDGPTYADGWIASNTLWVTILVDKTVWFNQAITAAAGSSSQAFGIEGTIPLFGDSVTDANGSTFDVDDVFVCYSDRANPIGKVTVDYWRFTLGQAPPAGFDQSVKSAGADAAALVDERPPAGSGTTDADYYQLIDDGTHLKQQSRLDTSPILVAGDVPYMVQVRIWDRQNTSSKTSGIVAEMHDGTNARRNGGNVLINGPSSYAENLQSGEGGTDGGASQSARFNVAPDGNPWSAKDNTYLTGCYAGCRMNGVTANASILVDAIVCEIAIVKNGDAIAALPDPGVVATTQRQRVKIV
jgi:hypothetical protein